MSSSNHASSHTGDQTSNQKKEDAVTKSEEREARLAAVDVFENEKEFLIVADLPGVPQNGADITLEKDRLVLQAASPTRKYRRELVVPPTVDVEGVAAEMKAGVLTVHLPKRGQSQPRQIQVRST
jgi:HSP20 family molecular chaperone IbpA